MNGVDNIIRMQCGVLLQAHMDNIAAEEHITEQSGPGASYYSVWAKGQFTLWQLGP
jgi:hypothetical protein